MSKVKLFNQSQRVIQIGTDKNDPTQFAEFGPKQVVSVDKETADKLLAMYEGEVVDLEQHTKDLSEQAKNLANQEPEKPVEVKLDKKADK